MIYERKEGLSLISLKFHHILYEAIQAILQFPGGRLLGAPGLPLSHASVLPRFLSLLRLSPVCVLHLFLLLLYFFFGHCLLLTFTSPVFLVPLLQIQSRSAPLFGTLRPSEALVLLLR